MRKEILYTPFILLFLSHTPAWGQTTVLSENFDAGGLPAGWTRAVATNCVSGAYNSWMNTSEISSSGSNWCGPPCTVGRGGAGRCMFFYDWFFTGVSGNYLQTPANDLSTYTSSSLTFYYYNSSGADVFNVYAKQGAGSYSLVGGPYATAGAAWTLVTIDMSAWAGAGFNQVYIKLEGNGVCGANNIGIDDFLLTGTGGTPAITLANNGTQVGSANVQQGTSAHVLHKISLAVTTANATLTGMQCVTTGTYASADITNLKVRYSTDATLDAGDATLSTYTTPGVAGTKTFPSFSSQLISNGSTGYVFITADVAGAATAGNTISVNAIATGDLTFSSGTKSGSSSAGGTQTIIVGTTPNISLADNSSQITAGNVVQGTSGHILHRTSLSVTIANATLTGMQCVTAGTYASADITNLKVRYSTDASLDAGDATLSTITSIGTAGTKTFTGFSSQLISSGSTGYLFITADVAAGATVSNTININAITTSHLTFSSGILSGASTTAGAQTFVSSNIIMSNSSVSVCSANFYDSGNSGGNYANNENYTLTVTPPPGNCTRVTFSSLFVELNYDYLYIYDGTSTSSPLITTLTGSTTPTSSYTSITGGGSMTFNFISDGGLFTSGWAATITCVAGCPIPTVNLADNGTQIAANTVGQGTTAHILHRSSIAVNNQNLAELTGINCTTTGSYLASDITNLKVRFSDDNTLNTGDATISTLTNPGAAGAKTFTPFTKRVIPPLDSGYIFITADVAAGATLGNTIAVNALSIADLSYFSAIETGSTTGGGTQTISNAPTNDHCTNAITLSVYATCTNTAGTSLNGTVTSPALTNCAGTEDDDVWYRFVATAATQTITVTPIGTYDAAFELRSGSCNGTQVAGSCTNALGNSGTETYYASGLTVASTYYIRVWNPNAGSGTNTFNICVTAPFVEHIFEKTFGMAVAEVAYDALKTSDGGFLLAGYTTSAGAGEADAYVVKTDNAGNVQWSKTYGAEEGEVFYGAAEASAGGYIFAGSSASNTGMGVNGTTDGWLARIDATGALSWNRILRGTNNNPTQYLFEVYETTGGFLYTGPNSISGTPCGGPSRGWDIWEGKTDASGNVLWSKTWGVCGQNDNMDGSYLLSTGEMIMAGWSDFGTGLLLVKKDAAGVALWGKSYNNTSSVPADVIQTADGSFVMAGYITTGGAGNRDMFLLKTDATGAISWMKAYGGASDDVATFIVEASDGGYTFGGYSTSFGANIYDYDGLLLKTNSDGVLQWSKRFGEGGIDVLHSARQTSYGGLIMSGYTYSAGAGNADMWLLVVNSNGQSTCETSLNSVTTTNLTTPTAANFGNDLDQNTATTPVPTVSSVTTTGGPKCEVFTPLPIELLNFNVSCEKNTVLLSWKTAMEQSNNYFSIERSSDGQQFYKIGTVNGAGNSNSILSYSFADENPLAGTAFYRLSQTDYNGESETFLPLSVSCSEESGFAVAVNPNLIHDGNVFVSISGAADEPVLVVMTDVLGRELYSVMLIESADSYLHSIYFGTGIAPGLYFITASSNDRYVSKKMVVK